MPDPRAAWQRSKLMCRETIFPHTLSAAAVARAASSKTTDAIFMHFFPPQNPEVQSISRQGIEDKLVEEYRRCPYFTQTQQQLGTNFLSGETENVPLTLTPTPNPCLYVLEWIRKDKDRKSTSPTRTITYNTSFLTQFKWVLKRTFRNLMLNPQTSVAQVNTSKSLCSRGSQTVFCVCS